VGTQVTNKNEDQVGAFGRDFPGPGVSTVSAAGTRLATEIREEETSVGVYVQEQLGWKNRLFLTGAVRFDDHSSFGDEFDFETYPKASVAWVISEEPWFQLPLLNTLKLRGAYGFAGRQPEVFSEFREFSPVSIRSGVPAVTPSQIGNPNLGPERSRELEIGFDANVWNDRIGIEVTRYDKTTEDALIERPNTPSLGFPGSQLFNLGEIENQGWELGINGLIVDTEIVDYEVGLTFATNENEVIELGEGVEPFPTPGSFDQRIVEGFPVQSYFDFKITGRNEDGTPIFSEEQEFLGRVDPGNWGSLSSTLTLWDDLRVYGLLDWKRDFKVNNNTEAFRWQFLSARERWDPDLQDTDEFRDKTRSIAIGSASPFVEDGDFFKLREISVSYTLPPSLAQMLRVGRAVVTGSGRNLKTWTDYSGVDPEVNVFGAANIVSSDFLSVPPARRFLLTLDLSW
jgi:hypothetical protein